MSRFEAIRDRLPTLYRPEDGDESLLTQFLRAVASLLDEADGDSAVVLRSHWCRYADHALLNPYFLRRLELEKKPLPAPGDPSLAAFPYIYDLGRLAALLSLGPWREPPGLRELVEQYRLRIARVVALHSNGLGTPGAVRAMVEANLPADLQGPAEKRDRPFELEEFAPLVSRSLAVSQPGERPDMVGPLMRWTAWNDGTSAAPVTAYVQGVSPESGVDATIDPELELYSAGSAKVRVAVAYQGTLATGQTLRLRPAYSSWLATERGVLRAESAPAESAPADPTAPGPWSGVPGAPTVAVTALFQSSDRALWVALDDGETGALYRYDGRKWVRALAGTPGITWLLEDGQSLLVGIRKGLLRMPLYPAGPFDASQVAGAGGDAVHALYRSRDGSLWAGTAKGVLRSGKTGSWTPFVLGASVDTETQVFAVAQDDMGTMYFGTALGLFQYQPGAGHWYWYEGNATSDQVPDWRRFNPVEDELPSEDDVFLPPVTCVLRGPDESLWLGTEAGLARYVARAGRPLTYQTILEAFPDLTTGRVHAIREDERGNIWSCTERGLFRFDGRDMWHLEAGAWTLLGRADTLYDGTPRQRGHWRYVRSEGQWQRFDTAAGVWRDFTGPLRTTEEPAVAAVAWTDSVAADLGTWDGVAFASVSQVPTDDLMLRYKPDETRIVAGGLPAVPRAPAGTSLWRYLKLEPEGLVEHTLRPSWTVEGRLLPPPSAVTPPPPGRYDVDAPPNSSRFATDARQAVFAYNPCARVWLQWEARRPLTVLARLKKTSPSETIDPAILDRVWQGIQRVRPAGVRAMLAVEEQIVRGK